MVLARNDPVDDVVDETVWMDGLVSGGFDGKKWNKGQATLSWSEATRDVCPVPVHCPITNLHGRARSIHQTKRRNWVSLQASPWNAPPNP